MAKDRREPITRPGAGRRKTSPPRLGRIKPVEGVSTERQVYQALRYAFMSGTIMPGSSLSSRSLSEVLGVSPTPVREALKRLDGDGAVVSRSKSAFFVYDPDKVDLAELFEVRLMLEGRAIRTAALNASKADISRIREINDEYQELLARKDHSRRDALQANFRFHFEIYKLSRSSVLVEMIEAIWLRIGPALHRYMPSHSDTSISDFHGRMLDALAGKDPEAAEAALHSDLNKGFETIEPQLRSRPALPSEPGKRAASPVRARRPAKAFD